MYSSVVTGIAQRLQQLHQNGIRAVPITVKRRKGGGKRGDVYREPCPDCPSGSRQLVGPDGKPRWYPPVKAHGLQEGLRAAREAEARGEDEHQQRSAQKKAERACVQAHDVPDHPRFWLWHVQGADEQGEFFHRGVYSNRVDRGVDVCWDLDKEFDPWGRAWKITEQLRAAGIPDTAVYCNTSYSGQGVHVRLCLAFLCPSWLRLEFGRKILEPLGLTAAQSGSAEAVEVFPKGARADYLGKFLNLPCALPLMAKGRTCVLDPSWRPITDPAVTLQRLNQVQQLSQDEFFAACKRLGIDPLSPPVEAPKPSRAPRQRVVERRHERVTYTRPPNTLLQEVRRRAPLSDFLSAMGWGAVDGDMYYCPRHEHARQDASMHVYWSTGAEESHERFFCHGDCDTGGPSSTVRGAGDGFQGDVVDMAAFHWRLSRREALLRLAREHGLDPDDPKYKTKVKVETKDPLPSEGPAVSVAPRHYGDLRRWLDTYARVARDPRKVLRAVARIALDEEGPGEHLKLKTLIRSLWIAGRDAGAYARRGEAEAEVANVLERVSDGKPCVGYGYLRRQFSDAQLRPLVYALFHAAENNVPLRELRTKVEGHRRYKRRAPGRKHLFACARSVGRLEGKPSTRDEKHHQALYNALRRPTACGEFSNVIWVREAGQVETLGTLHLRCGVDALCGACSQARVYRDWLITTGRAKTEEGDYSWTQRGDRGYFHLVEFVLPSRDDDMLKSLRRRVDRTHVPKLLALGTDLASGNPRVLYVTEDGPESTMILSAIKHWLHDHKVPHADLTLSQRDLLKMDDPRARHAAPGYGVLIQARAFGYEHAVEWVCDATRSLQVYAEGLVRAESDELIPYLAWLRGKHRVVARGKRCLPWPPRNAKIVDDEAEDGGIEVLPGQKATVSLVHNESQVTVAQRPWKRGPYTLDEAIVLADMDRTLHVVLERMDLEAAFQGAAAAPS